MSNLSSIRLLNEVEAQNEQLAVIEAESRQIQEALETQLALLNDLRRRREERQRRQRQNVTEENSSKSKQS